MAITLADTKVRMPLEGPAYGRWNPNAQPRRQGRGVVKKLLGALRRAASSFGAREVALVIFAYFAYFLVRGFTEGNASQAIANGDLIIEIEKALGFYWEPAVQDRIVEHHWIVTVANWVYIWGHWPFIAGVAAWLLWKRPEAYSLFRNAFVISGAIGIVIFMLFPVAPPRLMPDAGLVDTVSEHSNAYRVLQPPAFVNQYAAVPSLHFGWNLLIGIALITQSRWVIARIAGVLSPMLMASAIVLTANHYIFDAVAGGAVALTGLAAAVAWSTYKQREAVLAEAGDAERPEWRPQPQHGHGAQPQAA